MSIKRNCVTLALNSAIEVFPKAEYIYKIDEDIFLTKHFFPKLRECYDKVENDSEYIPAFVAPLIPINAYGYLRLLRKFFLEQEYMKLFEKPKYAGEGMIAHNPNVATYFWGGEGIPHIDILDTLLSGESFNYSVCPVRFSIGAILLKRKTWEDMGAFKVNKGNDMGSDEIQLCSLAMTISRAIIVSENTCVGHFSFNKPFGETNTVDVMKQFFYSHQERFQIQDNTEENNNE
jgi:hypothetical protein